MLTHRDRRATMGRSPCPPDMAKTAGGSFTCPSWPKSRPPLRGRPEKAAGRVGRLVRATSPARAALLAGDLLRTIPTVAGIEYGPRPP